MGRGLEMQEAKKGAALRAQGCEAPCLGPQVFDVPGGEKSRAFQALPSRS